MMLFFFILVTPNVFEKDYSLSLKIAYLMKFQTAKYNDLKQLY